MAAFSAFFRQKAYQAVKLFPQLLTGVVFPCRLVCLGTDRPLQGEPASVFLRALVAYALVPVTCSPRPVVASFSSRVVATLRLLSPSQFVCQEARRPDHQPSVPAPTSCQSLCRQELPTGLLARQRTAHQRNWAD